MAEWNGWRQLSEDSLKSKGAQATQETGSSRYVKGHSGLALGDLVTTHFQTGCLFL